MTTLIGMPGSAELLLVFAVLVLFVGGAKLPELARGTGRALRIFKAETREIVADDAHLGPDEQ